MSRSNWKLHAASISGWLTVAEANPPETIAIADETGYRGVSLTAGSRFLAPEMRAAFVRDSVIDDAVLRRETLRRSKAAGVSLDLMEGIILSPFFPVNDVPQLLDVMQELEICSLATFDADEDRSRARDHLASLCTQALERGIKVCLEFHPHSFVPDAAAASRLIESGEFRGLGILVDALHLARGGGTPSDVARLDPSWISGAQFCDGPIGPVDRRTYRAEAMFERQVPGDGALPLLELFSIIPADRLIYLEVPMRHLQSEGVSAKARAQLAINGMRALEQRALGPRALEQSDLNGAWSQTT